jgi:hypothetical protein
MEKSNLTLIEFFKSMVYERSTIPLVAKFAHEVLEVFYANAVFRFGLGYNCGWVLMFLLVFNFLLLLVVWVLQRDGKLGA